MSAKIHTYLKVVSPSDHVIRRMSFELSNAIANCPGLIKAGNEIIKARGENQYLNQRRIIEIVAKKVLQKS